MRNFLRMAALLSFCWLPGAAQYMSIYGPQSSLVAAGIANCQFLMNQTSLMVMRAQLHQSTERLGRSGTGQGGTVRASHHHFITGMHPAELRPAVNANGELLLNVKFPDPRNPKKSLNLNFVTGDSVIDESSGAAERLRDLAAELKRRGAQ